MPEDRATDDDIVEQGVLERGPDRGPGGGSGRGVRIGAALITGGLALFALASSGLLSADPPGPDGSDAPAPTGAPRARLVAQVDDHLVLAGQDDWSQGPRLPRGSMLSGEGIVPVLTTSGRTRLVATHRGLLLRVDPSGEEDWVPIGRAQRVVAASRRLGRVLVMRGGGVVEVEVATGAVTDAAPYPGLDSSAGWTAEALYPVSGIRTLLLSRATAGATEQELALAWPARQVEAGAGPALRMVGTVRRLLAVTDDWLLTPGDGCPGPGCRLLVINVTRDDVLLRELGAPDGWTFTVDQLAGRSRQGLVAVRRLEGPDRESLARVAAGGETALLVAGTDGLDRGAGLVDDLDGSVRMVTEASPGAPERVREWSPYRPGRAVLVGRAGDLPETAELVCVCG